jgi:DNA invertase Pin-like site-specific DNA recombinase
MSGRGMSSSSGRLDRLGRSLPHLIETVTQLEQRKVGLHSLTESIDTTTPGGGSSSTFLVLSANSSAT